MIDEGLLAQAHEPVFVPHLLLAGLERSKDSPCVSLGERVLTGREVYEQISCYAQAFAKVGLTQGSRIAVLSPNRPEVLFAMGANQVTGCRTSALHPLGSLDDHAYVIDDAEVEYLLIDPSFGERASALQERVPPRKPILAFGELEGPVDVTALATSFTPGKLTIPTLSPDDVTGLS